MNWHTGSFALALALGMPFLSSAARGGAQATLTPSGETPTVGMPARWSDVVLPGTELEALTSSRTSPVALRIVATRPHGDAFRYDFEFWGLEPGIHDLRALLVRKDGSSKADLPALEVTVRSTLDDDGMRLPHAPKPAALPELGGYETLLAAGGVVWVAGLSWMLLAGRRRRMAELAAQPKARSLAERLRPLVERAMRGELSREERAALELSLVALWRRRLGLDSARPAEVIAALRQHPEAGPLLVKLEEWLHRPQPRGAEDIPTLLAPYRSLKAEELDGDGVAR
jgi:hypothetical protein